MLLITSESLKKSKRKTLETSENGNNDLTAKAVLRGKFMVIQASPPQETRTLGLNLTPRRIKKEQAKPSLASTSAGIGGNRWSDPYCHL